jgi:uncharacterized protein YndB with AHSA1/START domain
MIRQMNFEKDPDGKKITVTREFAAPVEKVWRAWTEKELLDQWWAPKPWKAKTKSMDFRVGGFWLYAMVSPEGESHWARADYLSIRPQKSYSVQDAFCDENGVKNTSVPSMHWNNQFSVSPSGTTVTIEIIFSSEEDLKTIIEMGFREGFTAALTNLDELLEK